MREAPEDMVRVQRWGFPPYSWVVERWLPFEGWHTDHSGWHATEAEAEAVADSLRAVVNRGSDGDH